MSTAKSHFNFFILSSKHRCHPGNLPLMYRLLQRSFSRLRAFVRANLLPFCLEFKKFSEYLFWPNVVVHLTSLTHIFYRVWTRLFFRKRIFHTLDEARQTNTMFETKGKRKKRWEIIEKMHTIDVIDKCRIPKGDLARAWDKEKNSESP